jgi:hypothetical protein
MTPAAPLLALAFLAATGQAVRLPGPEGPPVALENAKLDVRPLAGSLADTVRGVAGPSWIGYSVPSLRHGHMCCWDSVREVRSRRGCCWLEGRGNGEVKGNQPLTKGTADAATTPTAIVMLRVEKGRVGRVGAYSADCALDAGGKPVLWLSGVPPAQSLAVLEPLVGGIIAEEVLAAVAAHADAGADAILERQAAPARPAKVREQAAFWMGESRGRRGYETLKRLLRDDADPDFREHVVFALSESDVPEATDAIIETARRDRDADVRGQALFWLAQKAGKQAAATITRAIEEDPETEVKKKAVFALSEMPDGVPLLIKVARTSTHPAVREQAFFWLGQSEDPRALDFLAEVLKRP